MKVSGEHAHRVIANPHRAASSPEEQPLQLTVTEQCLSAEVPGGKTSAQLATTCVLVLLDMSDLIHLMRVCHSNRKKVYLIVNGGFI